MNNRIQPEATKAYPARVWLVRPVKTVLILSGIITGLIWISGGMIENLLPQGVTITAAIVCLTSFLAYFIMAAYGTRKRERFAARCMAARKERLAELAKTGFVPTRKFIGSSRMFAVDENSKQWILIDYFNEPEKAQVHSLASITDLSIAENRDWIKPGHTFLQSTGLMLSKKDSDTYFEKMGILLTLSEPECPAVFISCYKTENDLEIIPRFLEPLVDLDAGTNTAAFSLKRTPGMWEMPNMVWNKSVDTL